ncbi:PepSY domain-containing protein [Bacillus sp. FJAT-27245]|uniref:PepSY domain-containing protein n=1 Tax=Bacillus sp. FJAT-27245 TaxID=1684144 RepID=UPI0006A758E1|nr:PepSY domain-containing protein [Bacillus sp. FJAT-27245]
MKNKLLAAGVVFGLIAGGTFAVGAAEKDDTGRELKFEQKAEHGVDFVKTEGNDVKKAIENAASISFAKAAEIAKSSAKGEITEAEAELEHGRVEYEFELKDGKKETELKIDGNTGKILKIETEDDRYDDEGDDD